MINSFQALLAAGPAPRSNGRTCTVCTAISELDAVESAALSEMIRSIRWSRQAIADAITELTGTTVTRNMVSAHTSNGHHRRTRRGA